MSIQKKSLISTLKTAKKAHVASAPLAESGNGTKGVKMAKAIHLRKQIKLSMRKTRQLTSLRTVRFKK